MPNPPSKDDAKEPKELTKLVSGRKRPTAKKLTPNEAGAVLKYIDALEKATGPQPLSWIILVQNPRTLRASGNGGRLS